MTEILAITSATIGLFVALVLYVRNRQKEKQSTQAEWEW